MTKQKGIALVQVLIITAILSVIAIYITKSARLQIQVATWATDKSQATIIAHSAQNKLIFELLTRDWQTNNQDPNLNSISAKWNFYNQPFELQAGVVVNLQDQAGLIDIHYPNRNVITRRLLLAGLSDGDAQEAVDILLDWQDSDSILRRFGKEFPVIGRNGPMADIREWLLQGTLSEQQFENIREDFSIAGAGHLNLMNSPKSLLTALTNESIADEVVRLRNNNSLNRQLMSRVTGILQDEDIIFAVSNKQRISITVAYGEAEVNKQIQIELDPYSTRDNKAYYITQSEGN
ncbi:MAG: general secretion pathway protein K [Colwellia sp.]|jgi:general secretion pathway protein K